MTNTQLLARAKRYLRQAQRDIELVAMNREMYGQSYKKFHVIETQLERIIHRLQRL